MGHWISRLSWVRPGRARSGWVGSRCLTGRFGSGQQVLKTFHGLGQFGPDHDDPTRPARTDQTREKSLRILKLQRGYLVGQIVSPSGIPVHHPLDNHGCA